MFKAILTLGLIIFLTSLCTAQNVMVPKTASKDEMHPWGPTSPPPGMVKIPAGEFEMGRHVGSGSGDEYPVHAVYIDEFCMDILEVTNEQYCDFLNSAYGQGLIGVDQGKVYRDIGGPHYDVIYCSTTSAPTGYPYYGEYSRITWNGSLFGVVAGKEDHPMIVVNWYGAAAYANWKSAECGLANCYDFDTWECSFGAGGFRLPTEAEWEKAARGGEHNPYYQWPWGNNIDGSKANYRESGDPYEGTDSETTPVGYYDGSQIPAGVDMANGYGLYDMAGNVAEWCNDWYDYNYYGSSPYDNPQGPSSGSERVFRGGHWYCYPNYISCATRGSSDEWKPFETVGFRLVLN